MLIVYMFMVYIAGLATDAHTNYNEPDGPVQDGRFHTMAECQRVRSEIITGMRTAWTIHGPRPDMISECFEVKLHP